MRRIAAYLFLCLLAVASCTVTADNPYEGFMGSLEIEITFPEEYDDMLHEGIAVNVEEINLGSRYAVKLDENGKAVVSLPGGLYRLSVSDRIGRDIFNSTMDRFPLTTKSEKVSLSLKHSKAGSIVIKEIYCGGCRKDPDEGDYQSDQYVILHNNDFQVQYLDSLCFGTLYPYNAAATNPFVTRDGEGNIVFRDYAAITDAVWQFPGDGHSFPLLPGEDAVLCIRGAIDHAAKFPLSVNLNKSDYFVMYNSNYFTNQTYNPVPGSNIQDDHILNCLVKNNPKVNATMLSLNSPAVVIYRARGITMHEYLMQEGSIIPIPASTNGSRVLVCPLDWVLDAVEVFDGTSSSNVKRLQDVLDAGYVTQTGTFLGHTLMRRVDEELTASSGYEVLMDTNNSSADMYEREIQSLHE